MWPAAGRRGSRPLIVCECVGIGWRVGCDGVSADQLPRGVARWEPAALQDTPALLRHLCAYVSVGPRVRLHCLACVGSVSDGRTRTHVSDVYMRGRCCRADNSKFPKELYPLELAAYFGHLPVVQLLHERDPSIARMSRSLAAFPIVVVVSPKIRVCVAVLLLCVCDRFAPTIGAGLCGSVRPQARGGVPAVRGRGRDRRARLWSIRRFRQR